MKNNTNYQYSIEAIQDFITSKIEPEAEAFDEQQAVPYQLVQEMAEYGLMGTCIAKNYGGIELDALSVGQISEKIGYASGSVLSLFTVHSMVSWAISRWGTASQKETWLVKLAQGEKIAAFALSEPDVGSDVQAVNTTFTREGDKVVISGKKMWISFAQIADVFFVVGQLSGKLTAILIDRNTPGLTIEPIKGMYGFRSAMLGKIDLSECQVPATNLIGSSLFGLSQIVGSVLDQGRFTIAWGALGLAQACIDASLAYSSKRQQFGKPLKQHQLIQAMLTNMMVETKAARLLCRDAAETKAKGDPDMIIKTSVAKYFTAKTALSVANDAVQIFGANGLSSQYPLQRYLRDAKILNVIEGSSQIQQQLIATQEQHWLQR